MATPQFINWIEGRAERLRSRCSLSPFAQLDPFELAVKMDVPVVNPREIDGLDSTILDQVLNTGGKEWDAATIPLPEGNHVIVMNPNPALVRQRASLMEELAHIDLGHKPGKLTTVNGLVLRSWKQSHETEAYWVGAAALAPRCVLKGAITRRMTIDLVASNCGVSTALIVLRENILGLKLLRSPASAIEP